MRSRTVDSQQSTADRKTVMMPVVQSIAHGFSRGKQSAVNWFNSGMMIKLVLLIGCMITIPSLLMAQTDTTQTHAVDMATTMRSNGKIYVVVAVLTIILLGLFFYLIRLDRKIGKLEKE